ncbi:hypothetical protein LCR01_06070 [Companilactobacillus crustorum]|uniref:Uncharacterized protein n=2 Tax=Companilactobacillus TaxID=2767879 RepID=A0A2P4R9X7_9LACO|nr:hypothetical protein [Companilactobacillus crustorum]KRO21208.1 hypothetical protein IV63_GL001936 [Companilactobacillus crustorum]GEO76164.1 hypothetical protein LCR01_06070 [Companilactobacillus crustorum]
MTTKTSKYRILETNVLLERFVTYNEVFTEYLKTIKLIERGEALRYETYSRWIDNYLTNIKSFIKLCNSYLSKYNLENSTIAEKLNNYFMDLIDMVNYMDVDHNLVDHSSIEKAQSKIRARQEEFLQALNILVK